MLSVRGLCDELVPRPEEYYRVWCVSECDRGISKWGLGPLGLSSHEKVLHLDILATLNVVSLKCRFLFGSNNFEIFNSWDEVWKINITGAINPQS